MSRSLTRSLQVVLDLGVLSAAYWLGFFFRFELALPGSWLRVAMFDWPYVIALQYAVLTAFGVPRFSWRYVSLHESERILTSIACSGVALVIVRLILGGVDGSVRVALIPLGVLGMDFCLAFVGLIGIRAARRVYGEARERRDRGQGPEAARVLLIGAGAAGVIVARELAARPDLGLVPVGFLDDNRLKIGTEISGLRVLGTTAQLAQIAELKHAKRALITIASAPGAEIRRITLACREAGLETKIIPGIYEIVGDALNLSRIREVAIEDVLGREPVNLDEAQVTGSIRGEVVMVTGAGGSIGSELCRQICRFGPQRLLLVERFENALFEIHRELERAYPGVTVEPFIADVCDRARMEHIFALQRPAVVVHAAAHKHVPMMEQNAGEAVKNNVGGTRVVADLADQHGVARFVLVSTDKAVNPTSVMGATKRVAEIYTQALAQRSRTKFVTVRFGNVLGSNGSVIPIFKQQIAAGGPVTITHPEMRRYFMTIPEASQLVLQAGAMGTGGEIFILDMGEPVKIVDLARDLISLSGLRPDEDIEIQFTGIRPGEKLFEELATDTEHADATKHPKVFIGRVRPIAWDEALRSLAQLVAIGASGDGEAIRRALRDLVPEYTGATASTVVAPAPAPAKVTNRSGSAAVPGTGEIPAISGN